MQKPTIALLGAALLTGAVAVYYFGQTRRVPEPTPAPIASAPAPAPSASVEAPPPEPLPQPRPVGSAPPLPADAPRKVALGVVLVTYRGAEGAPATARTKAEALEKAKGLLAEAQRDFAGAVKQGDRGSTADAGNIPRGVLEPELEYAVFTLQKGQVAAEPLDTPRGFWVVRRNN
jgi:hypothetical protein